MQATTSSTFRRVARERAIIELSPLADVRELHDQSKHADAIASVAAGRNRGARRSRHGQCGTGGYSRAVPDYDSNSGNGQTPFPSRSYAFPVTVRSVDNYYNLVQPNAKVQLIAGRSVRAGGNDAASSQRRHDDVFYIFTQTKPIQAPGWTITRVDDVRLDDQFAFQRRRPPCR